jgi:purine-binding chemotaxis protein CheW
MFGIEVQDVQEILRFQEITPVPLASHIVRGLMNLRGQIVVVLDLRKRLGVVSDEVPLRPVNVLVRQGESVVSLLADRVGDVIEVDDDSFEEPPENLDAATRNILRGAFKLPDRLMLALDTTQAANVH